MKGGGEKTYSFWKINKIRLESLGGGLGGMSGFFSDVSTEQKNKILGVIVSHVEGPDPGTVVIVERSRPRGASLVCTGMCRPLGLSTSRLCSTRACSRAARSPPPWCRTHRRYRVIIIISGSLSYVWISRQLSPLSAPPSPARPGESMLATFPLGSLSRKWLTSSISKCIFPVSPKLRYV